MKQKTVNGYRDEKYIYGLDLMKFILCFFICAIHIQPFSENSASVFSIL